MVNPDNTKINYVPSDDPDTEQSQVVPVRPSTKSTKDFKKVLSKDEGEEKEGKGSGLVSKKKNPVKMFSEPEDQEPVVVVAKPSKDDEEDASQIAPMSLFDLSKQGHKEKIAEFHSKTGAREVANVESPSDLFKRMSSKGVAKAVEKTSDHDKVKTDHFNARYAQEQPDLSYVNPMAGIQQPQVTTPITSAPKVEGPRSIDPAMQLLIEQVVKQMYTVDTQGKTDTVMVLQYPPLFKDAKIVVSAYDSAKGQFNISFENLTQAAQKILDLEANKKSLVLALEHRGYNIQAVTTTTIQLQNIVGAEQPAREGREQQREGQERNQSDQQRKQQRG